MTTLSLRPVFVLAAAAFLATGPASSAELRGRLSAEGGKPVPKAVVRVLPETPAAAVKGAKPVRVESGADGSFALAGLTGETFLVRIEAKGYASLTQPGIPAGASLELHLRGGVRVAGIVRDRGTKVPIAGATVAAWEKGADAFGEDAYRKATSGKDGRFTVDDLAAGKVTVEAKAAGHSSARAPSVSLPKSDLELLLDIAGGLNGTVTDTTGQPVKDAEVKASLRGGKSRAAKSGPDGYYRIADAPPDAVDEMRVKAPKFLIAEHHGAAPSDGIVDFTLERGGSIEGTVHGFDGKTPASFHVKLHPDGSGSGIHAVEHDFSDPSGAFRLDELEPGKYVLEVSADKYAASTKKDIDVAPEQIAQAGTITLQSRSVLRGRVVTARDKAPIAGATIHISLVEAGSTPTPGSDSSWSATSSTDGTFSTTALPDGTFDVAVEQPQYAPARTRITFHPDADTPEITLEMSHGGTLTGSVVDGKLEPVPNVRIVASLGTDADSRVADTGSDGRYLIDGLAPGTWTVSRQQAPQAGSTATDVKYASIREGETTEVNFDERPRVSVSGVVMKGDVPVPQASIYFVSIDNTTAHDGKSTQSDAQGTYQIGLLHGGKYQVSVVMGSGANPSAHSVVTLNIPDQSDVRQDIIFTVHAITGHVYDPDRKGVKGAMIIGLRDGTVPGDAPRQSTTTTADDGSYRIDAVDPGTYKVTARAKSYTSADEYPVLVSDDKPDPDVDLTLQRGWVMRGHVLDPQGSPVPGALVVVAPNGAAESGYLPSQSDASGAFRITAPSDGPVNVAAISSRFAPAVELDIEQPADGGTTDIQLHATPGGSLRVRVAHRSGEPVAGIQLGFSPVPLFPGCDVVSDRNRPRPTDADGTTLLTQMYPGDYVLSIPGRRDVAPIQVRVSEGAESEAQIEVP